ncbi:MAG: DUF503 domain-containing protein [Anaerolineae bacterium]|uniref:DUF503 domain-containing protein n=1 Tax=Promineifilum sp. TaxID=2664178 RepID=UPI001D3CBCF8|nr:DUF503 domain-containing protein [Anaerolineales bacterium]MCB8934147.1 DUF503 domain-containing protein [Promineifilum sp.]MCO5179769.1 DUF503 domain-containing protein [Promineifilum sp.]MCW5845671.1 DUF503 domain-containing protein [Anaerolineae bacterium]
MFVATCVITLELEGVHSLKEKRSIVKSLVVRLQREFNVSVAEVDGQDAWGTAIIGLAAVGNDKGYLHRLLEKSVAWVETHRPDVPIAAYSIEFW